VEAELRDFEKEFHDFALAFGIAYVRIHENDNAFMESLKRKPAIYEQRLTDYDREFLKGLKIEAPAETD
jgi:hypothetical protein